MRLNGFIQVKKDRKNDRCIEREMHTREIGAERCTKIENRLKRRCETKNGMG